MATNLMRNYKVTAFIDTRAASYDHSGETKDSYSISLIGDEDKDCKIIYRKSWTKLLKVYQDLMDGKEIEEDVGENL